MIVRPNGLAELLGEDLALQKPLYTSGSVWYVNSSGGVDGGGSAGKDRQKPLATLAQAQTNATAGDIICLMAGHAETYTAVLSLSKQLSIVGGGSGNSMPSFTMNAANQNIFDVSAANIELRGIKFKESSQTNVGSTNGAKVQLTAVAGCEFIGCVWEQGAKDNLYGLAINNSNNTRIKNCTFTSTATVVATRPLGAINVVSGTSPADLRIEGLVLSDGTVGYQNPAFNGSAATAITRLRVMGLSLLLGAEMEVGTLNAGYVGNPTNTDGGRFSG